MGHKLKITDIIRLPGPPRFIAVLESKNKDFAPLCTITKKYRIRYRMSNSFKKFKYNKINDVFHKNYDNDNKIDDIFNKIYDSEEDRDLQFKYAEEEIFSELNLDLNKLKKRIRKMYTDSYISYDAYKTGDRTMTPFTSGYIYEYGIVKYYLISQIYDLPENFENQFAFLPENNLKFERRYEEYLNQCIRKINKFIIHNPISLPIFSYTLLALTENVLNYYYTEDTSFSLWVHSSEYKNARNTANLFSNMFTYKPQSIYNYHKFHINISAKTCDLDDYIYTFNDLPLIIYSNSHKHTLSSSKVQAIIDKKYSNIITFSPVFISSSSNNSNKVLNIRADKLVYEDDFETIKNNLNIVYHEFICFICQLKNTDKQYMLNDIIPEFLTSEFHERIQAEFQSKEAFPFFNHFSITMEHIYQEIPLRFETIADEILNVRNDIIKCLPKYMREDLNIDPTLVYIKKSNRHKKILSIQFPMLSREDQKWNDFDEYIFSDKFFKYLTDVLKAMKRLQKRVCFLLYIYKLCIALGYYDKFMSNNNLANEEIKTFMCFSYKALNKLLHKQPLISIAEKQAVSKLNDDVTIFIEQLKKTVHKHLGDIPPATVIKSKYRISPGMECNVYEVDRNLIKELLNNHITTPERKFLNELAHRDILIRNDKIPKQTRFVFQRTVKSKPYYFYIIREDSLLPKDNKL